MLRLGTSSILSCSPVVVGMRVKLSLHFPLDLLVAFPCSPRSGFSRLSFGESRRSLFGSLRAYRSTPLPVIALSCGRALHSQPVHSISQLLPSDCLAERLKASDLPTRENERIILALEEMNDHLRDLGVQELSLEPVLRWLPHPVVALGQPVDILREVVMKGRHAHELVAMGVVHRMTNGNRQSHSQRWVVGVYIRQDAIRLHRGGGTSCHTNARSPLRLCHEYVPQVTVVDEQHLLKRTKAFLPH